jgi:hypothetical protein
LFQEKRLLGIDVNKFITRQLEVNLPITCHGDTIMSITIEDDHQAYKKIFIFANFIILNKSKNFLMIIFFGQ